MWRGSLQLSVLRFQCDPTLLPSRACPAPLLPVRAQAYWAVTPKSTIAVGACNCGVAPALLRFVPLSSSSSSFDSDSGSPELNYSLLLAGHTQPNAHAFSPSSASTRDLKSNLNGNFDNPTLIWAVHERVAHQEHQQVQVPVG